MISTKLTHLQQASEAGTELVRSLFEIHVQQSDERIPTHFVLLLDTSGSMEEKKKLENVKKCVELLLNILTPDDRISVVTFADDSKIVLKRVPADSLHKDSIISKLSSIHANGSTNMSASAVNLQNVVQDETMKTGVILLTDGHANIGIYDTPSLTTMFRNVREKNPLLTIACLAYGTDHNAELLKQISTEGSGSYAIVNSLEDAATAIGDVFGSFVSCCAQNVDLHLPLGTTIEGSHTTTMLHNSVSLRIGDIYTGSQTMYLVNIPANYIRENKPLLTLYGTKIPQMEALQINCDAGTYHLERHRDVDLTLLRYRCATLFKRLADWETLRAAERANLQEDIRRFSDEIQEEFFNGHTITEMLRGEATSLTNSITMLLQRRSLPQSLRTHLVQHEAVMSSGHGYTQSIEQDEDPNTYEVRSAMPVDDSRTPFRNNTQRTIASVMRSMTSQ